MGPSLKADRPPYEFYRNGRRAQAMRGDRALQGRPRSHARKSTMVACEVHPSVAHAPGIYKPNPDVVEEAAEAYEHANEGGQPLHEWGSLASAN